MEFKNLQQQMTGCDFLKLRSLSRREQLEYLIDKLGLEIGSISSREWLKLIYESNVAPEDIDDIILDLYEKEREIRRENEQQWVSK